MAVDQRGYTGKAWALSGYQSGLGYRPKASAETSLGTPGYTNARIVSEIPTRQISVSELMFTSQGGIFSLPQWIELYNNSNTEVVNIEGWKLAVETRDATGHHRYLVIVLEALEVLPNQTVLLVTGVRRDSGHFPTSRIYNLYRRHTNAFVQYRYPNSLLSASGFAVKLSLSDDTLVDLVGNLDGKKSRDAPSWELPSSETTEGVRTSLIRRYENRLPLSGTVVSSWVRAADTALIGVHTYWGSPMDNGTPGYRQGGPLPVTLSNFRADRTELGVVLEWRTESEVENAGFNILRSQTRQGTFVKVNPTLIPGAGTTGERHTYTWTDTTTKPNVAYYYQIEDVSFSGVRQQLATVRLKGHVSASGKLTTTWVGLKVSE